MFLKKSFLVNVVFLVSKLRQTKLRWFQMEFQIIWSLTLSIRCSGNPLSCSITWLTAHSLNTFSCEQPVRKHHRHYRKVKKNELRVLDKIPKQTRAPDWAPNLLSPHLCWCLNVIRNHHGRRVNRWSEATTRREKMTLISWGSSTDAS